MSAMTYHPPACKHFTGYKPCFPNTNCLEECVRFDPIGTKILIVNLDAMGNVLVTTSILPAIKRKYPQSHVTWITLKNAAPLLANNPLIDRVYLWEPESWLILRHIRFDVVMNVDKSQRSCALTMELSAGEKLGFGLSEHGAIIPLNPESEENYRLGLDDHLKFRVNTKTVSRLQCEQFKLEYGRDEYVLNLSAEEEAFCERFKAETGLTGEHLVVGLNTGCSELYPNKKLTVDQHVLLIEALAEMAGVRCVLKHVIAWFGVSCWTEVDLFDRGIKLIPEGLECSPCWKRTCPYNLECIQLVDLDSIIAEVERVRASGAARAIPTAAVRP
ncbi:MAG: putative heptosyltransferase [Bacteroidetes bacterium]|nr:putative heptosyltransferase [Bacteroidota bacterium]